jgi:hypothetical protein
MEPRGFSPGERDIIRRMRISAALAILIAAVMCVSGRAAVLPPAQGDCVAIGTPKPSLTYTYRHTDANGAVTQSTNQWESVTPTGSRHRAVGSTGLTIQENEHHIVDDVAYLDRQSVVNERGARQSSTVFKPAIVSAPAFRACAGKSWKGEPSMVTFQSAGRGPASAKMGPVSLRIVAIREAVSVAAGRFDTVHYIRESTSLDEYWKSTEHGVVVRHTAKIGGRTVMTQELVSIK